MSTFFRAWDPSPPASRLLALASCMAIVAANDAAAQGRRARLSEDLEQKIQAGDARPTSVILTGSQAKVDELAARHGLRVARRLDGGAVAGRAGRRAGGLVAGRRG